MRIRVGDQIFDSSEQPIMIIMQDDGERKGIIANLSSMEPKEGVTRKYVEAPDTANPDDLRKFMDIDAMAPSVSPYTQGQLDLIDGVKQQIERALEAEDDGADIRTSVVNILKQLKPIEHGISG